MLLTDISNILCYDESIGEKKIQKLHCMHGAGKGRMRGRVGNANETEIKKKKVYVYV